MNELSINIHIAGRSYPLTISKSEEAEVRAAGKLIQEKLNSFQEQFALKDPKDALAMAALDLANENRLLRNKLEAQEQEYRKEISGIENLLSSVKL